MEKKEKQMKKREKNYWPHAVVGSILLIVVACGYTIKIAMDNPVEMDSYYMEKYQTVDSNINDILEKQALFDAAYKVKIKTQKFSLASDNTLQILITDASDTPVNNAKIKLLISRPETNKYNQEIQLDDAKDGIYTVDGIKVSKPGRWQILTRVSIEQYEGYNKNEVFAN